MIQVIPLFFPIPYRERRVEYQGNTQLSLFPQPYFWFFFFRPIVPTPVPCQVGRYYGRGYAQPRLYHQHYFQDVKFLIRPFPCMFPVGVMEMSTEAVHIPTLNLISFLLALKYLWATWHLFHILSSWVGLDWVMSLCVMSCLVAQSKLVSTVNIVHSLRSLACSHFGY